MAICFMIILLFVSLGLLIYSNLLKSKKAFICSIRHASLPSYLQETYWWAYLHPKAIWFFDRQWIVNLILLGNAKNLIDSAINEVINDTKQHIAQLACVYGNFSEKLSAHMHQDSVLSICDIAPMQLKNSQRKLKKKVTQKKIQWLKEDSSQLTLASNSQDVVYVFFLLHEQPKQIREKTILEALRIVKPHSGKVVFVDYHKPSTFNLRKLIITPVLYGLEPYALPMYHGEQITDVLSHDHYHIQSKNTYAGGLYQKVVFSKLV